MSTMSTEFKPKKSVALSGVAAGSTALSVQLKVVTNKGKQEATSSDNRSTLKTKLHITQAQAITSFPTN